MVGANWADFWLVGAVAFETSGAFATGVVVLVASARVLAGLKKGKKEVEIDQKTVVFCDRQNIRQLNQSLFILTEQFP